MVGGTARFCRWSAVGRGGAGAFVDDAELRASLAPRVRPVARAVIGEDSFDGNAVIGEPFGRAVRHADGGVFAFVGVHFDVGDAGMVINDGVQIPDPEVRLVAGVAGAFAVGGDGAVLQRLLASDEAVPAAVGDSPELGDIDVDEGTGTIVLEAADRFPGDSVDARVG